MVTSTHVKGNFFLPFSYTPFIWALANLQLKLQLALPSKTALVSKENPKALELSSYPRSEMIFLLTCQAPPGGPFPSTMWGM